MFTEGDSVRSIQSTLFTLLAASSAAYADTTLNLSPGVSPISQDVYVLHMTVFWICVAIGVAVFGVMFYSIINHRKSKGAIPAEFHTHPVLEITWTIIPVIILVLMAIPATKVLFNMNNEDKEDLTIKITGYQWKWHYEYLEDGVSFFSNLSTPHEQIINQAPKGKDYLREVDNPLVVPIHKKIRFLITSNDVNHAWWVEDFGVKRDAISGFINEAWTKIDKPGTYLGQCAELCGVNHAFMPIVVVATTEQGYKDWVAKQKGQASAGETEALRAWTLEELTAQGDKVYSRICAACHQPGGVGLPPTFPALKGSKVALGAIEKHIDTVFNGVSGTPMQAFKNQLSDVELAAVITYERNAFGNNTGTMVQPIQIKALREGKLMADALAVQPAPAGSAPPTAAPPATPGRSTAAPAASPEAPIPPATSTPSPGSKQASANQAAGVTEKAPTEAEANTNEAQINEATQVSQSVPGTASDTKVDALPKTNSPAANSTAAATPEAVPAATSQPAAQPAAAATQPAASVAGQDAQSAAAAVAPSVDELKAAMVRGEKVYMGTCAACHQPSGAGMPPTFPALKGSPIATGPVAVHIDRVLNGKQGTAMMAFINQYTDLELADVITYERNAWGNNTGTLVTADQIKAVRQQEQKTQ